MDSERHRIAIVGAGPAGLSAAARAAAIDRQAGATAPSYVLLDAFRLPAKTIQQYQKGKLVMSEPAYLPLRSDLEFGEGLRETVLQRWVGAVESDKINIRLNSEIRSISGAKGNFQITLTNGSSLTTETVVLAIGNGSPNRLGVCGEDHERVQYQLDDPDEYRGERILVVGAGDAAIENALGLARNGHNEVTIVVRKGAFSRPKDANLKALSAAVDDPASTLRCLFNSSIKSIAPAPAGGPPLAVVLQTAAGEQPERIDRIIARLGTTPPRKFLETLGIRFPGPDAQARPILTADYQTSVPGIYVIGSLSGAELIKQAMNQGYDVVELIHGRAVRPADQPLLEARFCGLPFQRPPQDLLDRFKDIIPIFRQINPLAFREFVIESEVISSYEDADEAAEAKARVAAFVRRGEKAAITSRATTTVREGEALYAAGDFNTSFYVVLQGQVHLDPADGSGRMTLERGEFFGEASLLSGRASPERACTGRSAIVIKTPRKVMFKLLDSNPAVAEIVDRVFVARELQRQFAPRGSLRKLREIADRVLIREFKANESIVEEGATGGSLFVVRSGGVALFRGKGADARLVARVQAGQRFGETTLMGDAVRRESAVAVVATKLIEVGPEPFRALVALAGSHASTIQADVAKVVRNYARMEVQPEAGGILAFMMREGLGEATNVLVIDESKCTGCDNCERACADTHGGISRLDRRAGASFARVHIPVACRHCEQPHCMKECPPNAIRRAETGEVFINDTCIGCGKCVENCPYGVVRLEYDAPSKPGFLAWALFGLGPGPGGSVSSAPSDAAKAKGAKARKCDACLGIASGPACVQACPTGAALRIGPAEFSTVASGGQS
jgi:Fe-S-cluster-containing hydrogenase component 2/thioredoxin reductase